MAAPQASVAPDNTDEQLAEQVKRGDETAFCLLYERCFRRVYRFMQTRLTHQEQIERAAREALVELFSSLRSYEGEPVFAAWSLAIARRTFESRRGDPLRAPRPRPARFSLARRILALLRRRD